LGDGDGDVLILDDIADHSPALNCGTWPNKWVCVDPDGEGVEHGYECINQGCVSDGECHDAGLGETWECHVIAAFGHCIQPCTSGDGDGDSCHTISGDDYLMTECIGVADDNETMYCKEPPPP
jgi:hypothetical protein